MHPLAAEPSGHHVTAVLVAHDGARWLPAALAALAAQARPPDRVVAVDTGSTDNTRELLFAAFGKQAVLTLPRRTGFGAAVAAGLAAAETSEPSADIGPPQRAYGAPDAGPVARKWVWLLHDDCAPEPGALQSLIAAAEAAPSAGVLGPKVRGWPASRQLLEVGFTVDRVGRRETGLDRAGELDQGQHDGVRDVLAVGTAGMLVRRDVWDRLGGLDAALPVFGDDLDLCWRARLAGVRVLVVPAAVVGHAAAAATGARSVDAVATASGRTARRHGVYVAMVNLPPLALLLVVPRLVLGAVLGGMARLVLRRPGAAGELRAVGGVLLHPVRLLRGRWRRRRSRLVPARTAYPFLADPRLRRRRHRDALAGWAGRLTAPVEFRRRRGEPAGGGGSQVDPAARTGLLRALLVRPPVLLGVGLAVVALVAQHDLLGTGSLAGGRLLPAPRGASDLWSSYLASWHPVAAGTAASAPPYLALVAALAALLLGRAPLAVDVLLLGAVPLAGLSAYAASRRLTSRLSLRMWAAATYALLPAVTGAVAGGRLDAAAAMVALPLVLSGVGRALVADRREGWQPAWLAALGLSVAATFSPLLYVLLAPLLLATVLMAPTRVASRGDLRRGVRRSLSALVVLAVPPLLLLPWTLTILTHPSAALAGFGPVAGGLVDLGLRPVDLLLLHPGGPGLPSWWLEAPLLAAALAGLARTRGLGLAAAGWALALAGTAGGVLVARVTAAPLGGGIHAPVWPGVPTALAGAGLVLAAVVAVDGLFDRLTGHSFSWRQPAAVALSAAAAGVPVLAAASWVGGAGDTLLDRRGPSVLPAFVAAAVAGPGRPGALVLRSASDGTLGYAELRSAGSTLGESDLAPSGGSTARLTGLVRDLAAGRGGGVAERLSAAALGYVYAPPPADAGLTQALDGAAGLSRVAAGPGVRLWRVLATTGRLNLLPLAGQPTVLAAGTTGARTVLPPGPPGRLLVLAEPAERGWRATLDGRPMPRRTAYGWAQAFAVPPAGGRLVVGYDGSSRRHWLVGQAVLLAGLLLLAAPRARRPDGAPAFPGAEPLVIDPGESAQGYVRAPAVAPR